MCRAQTVSVTQLDLPIIRSSFSRSRSLKKILTHFSRPEPLCNMQACCSALLESLTHGNGRGGWKSGSGGRDGLDTGEVILVDKRGFGEEMGDGGCNVEVLFVGMIMMSKSWS